MGRLGLAVEDLAAVSSDSRRHRTWVLDGLSTHLASSEVLDAPSVPKPLGAFAEARAL